MPTPWIVDAPKQAMANTIADLIDRHLNLCGPPRMVVKQTSGIHAAVGMAE